MNIKKSDKHFIKHFLRGERKAVLTLLITSLFAGSAHALNWNDATMNSGSALGKTDGTTTTIVQTSQNGFYTWGGAGFNLTASEVLNLLNGQGTSLMYDKTGNVSNILGAINASGSLYIANAAGVVIGNGATIDVGGQFRAIAGTPDATDWLNKFALSSTGSVSNAGIIKAGKGVALIGPTVSNSGTITSADAIALGGLAGGTVVVDTAKQGKISFTLENVAGGTIANSGTIEQKAYTSAGAVPGVGVTLSQMSPKGSDAPSTALVPWTGAHLDTPDDPSSSVYVGVKYQAGYDAQTHDVTVGTDGTITLVNKQQYYCTNEGAPNHDAGCSYANPSTPGVQIDVTTTLPSQGSAMRAPVALNADAQVTLDTTAGAGSVEVGGNSQIFAQNLYVRTGELKEGSGITLGTDTDGRPTSSSVLSSQKDMTLETGATNLANTGLESVGAMNIASDADVNAYWIYTKDDLGLRVANGSANVGYLNAGLWRVWDADRQTYVWQQGSGSVDVSAAGRINTIRAESGLSAGDVRLMAGTNVTAGSILARAGQDVNGDITVVAAAGSVDTGAYLTGSAGNETLQVTQGIVAADGNIAIASGTDTTAHGALAAAEDIAIIAGGDVRTKDAVVSVTGDISMATAEGDITTEGVVTATAGAISMTAKKGNDASAGNVLNEKALTAGNNILIDADGNIHTKDTVTATNDILMKARGAYIQNDARVTSTTKQVDIRGEGAQTTTTTAEIDAGDYVRVVSTNDVTLGNVTTHAKDLSSDGILVNSKNGDVQLNGNLSAYDAATQSGAKVILKAERGTLTAAGTIEAKHGVDVVAGEDITFNGNVTSHNTGVGTDNIHVTSHEGSIINNATMSSGTDVTLDAGTDVTLGALKADVASGTIEVTAGRDILDNHGGATVADADITAYKTHLVAETGKVGQGATINLNVTHLSGSAATGFNVKETATDGLTVGDISSEGGFIGVASAGGTMRVEGNILNGTGNTTLTNESGDITVANTGTAAQIVAGGSMALNAIDGAITLEEATTVKGKTGVLLLAEGTGAEVVATKATVSSSEGMAIAQADEAIIVADSTVSGKTAVTLNGQSVAVRASDVDVTAGDLSVSADQQLLVSASTVDVSGEATLDAGQDITVETSTMTVGKSIEASADRDLTIAESELDAGENIAATAGNDLVVDASTVVAGQNVTAEAGNDVVVDTGDVTAGANFAAVAENDLSLTSATVTAAEDAVLRAAEAIVMTQSELSAGDQASATAKEVTMTAATFQATQDVSVKATAGNVTMDKDAHIVSTDADALVKAAQDVTVGQIEAAQDAVVVATQGDILRADGSTTDNVTATNVRLDAQVGNVGTQATAGGRDEYIHVHADNLQLHAGTDAYLNATKAVTVKDFDTAVEVTQVTYAAGTFGESSVTEDIAGTDAIQTGSKLRFNVDGTAGVNALIIEDRVATGTDARIETSAGSVQQDANVEVGTDLTLVSGEDLLQNADILTGTAGDTTAANSALIQVARDHVMADDTAINAVGNVVTEAGRDFHLETIETDANALVQAGRDIIDIDADTVEYDLNGKAQNLAAQELDISAQGNIALNAGGNIGAAGQQTEATDAIDVSTTGNVSAVAGGDLAVATPSENSDVANLNLGEVASFGVTEVKYATDNGDPAMTATQDAVVAGGTANLIANNTIVDANDDGVNITATNTVLTAGYAAGLNRDGNADALEANLSGTGDNAVWGNSTEASTGSVTMALRDPSGDRDLIADGGAKKHSGIVHLMDGRYNGGDRLFYNHMDNIHANNQRDLPIVKSDLEVFDKPDFIYTDLGVAQTPGGKYRKEIRPAAEVSVTTTEVDEEGNDSQTTETPFTKDYNPDEAAKETVKQK